MSSAPANAPTKAPVKSSPEINRALTEDARRQLVARILASPHFSKSARLCGFLSFITEETLAGRGEQLNEQKIGIQVFERRVDYDSAEDNIVRSHASRLRQRLEAYFQDEGKAETLHVELRRGSYIPFFEAISALEPSPQAKLQDAVLEGRFPHPGQPRRGIALLLMIGCLILIGISVYEHVLVRRLTAREHSASDTVSDFWGRFLLPGQRNLIVPADSSLVLFENLTGRPVSLQDYQSKQYLSDSGDIHGGSEDANARRIGRRRLTSIADLELATSLLAIPEVAKARPQIRFARDLQLADLKEVNLIFVGAEESDPWLSIFQPTLNFVISNDQKTTVFTVQNRAPKAGEPSTYVYDPKQSASKAYAVIAYRPNLSGTGNVLIVEGTGIAGTEAAADFLVDSRRFERVLVPIAQKNKPMPQFEILLQTNTLNGSAPKADVVAVRYLN